MPSLYYASYCLLPLPLPLSLPLSPVSALRHQCNQMAIHDMVTYLNSCDNTVAIFDATNHTQVRRADLVEKVRNGLTLADVVLCVFCMRVNSSTMRNEK